MRRVNESTEFFIFLEKQHSNENEVNISTQSEFELSGYYFSFYVALLEVYGGIYFTPRACLDKLLSNNIFFLLRANITIG